MTNKKKTLYILSGVPGCGKSTWARKLENEVGTIEVISRDQIRFSMVTEENGYFSKEKQVFNAYVEAIILSLCNHYNAITVADATHISATSRRKLVTAIKNRWPEFENEVEIIMIYFDVPFKTCIERNNQRNGRERVPMEAMQRMHDQHEFPGIEAPNHVATFIVRD